MKKLTGLFTIVALSAAVGVAQARDLGPDEALKLRDAGTVQPFDQLNAAAIARHPGSVVEETELEHEHGRYIYQVELRDALGVQWDLELDASTGQIVQDQRDG